MDIKLTDKHILKSDTYNFWIMMIVKPKDKEPYEKRVTGYFPTLDACLSDYVNKQFAGADVESVKDLAETVEGIKAEINTFCQALEKEGKIVRGR